ncbi:MAG: hypothetical protein E5Y32_00245 [Mesorhizobium sp.]|nr:MAG: hypothetical protein EOR98_21510 [Mesorhizobium sp.]RWN64303.1 MAG: hypothetical protein EOS00_03290 [Mesorhizobium sp.]RWN78532.1 MAG: hypothetical protein EOS01_17125 [Mesorhizobium sp.]RWN81135.1 MAG: hypothetical protein EOS02_04490 [Mesorhizobium sp.]RWN85088.1 MAG: hypothetical protein EOS04_24965 [Mesorhizobium sp.]
MRPFLILSLCNRSFARPALARSKPRRDEWPERERAYRKKGFGSQSGADTGPDIPASRANGWRVAEVWAVLSLIGTKDEIGKKAAIA